MRPRSTPDRRRLVAASAAIVAVLGVLYFMAPSFYEVEAKGKGPPLVPYEGTGLIYKVRVLGLFDVYADEESRPESDKLSAIGLVASASMCLMALLLLNAAGSEPRLRRFYAFTTAGLTYLAADELFAIHETLGHNLRFLADIPGVERPDDVIFLSYGIPTAIFAWAFRDILFADRRVKRLFGAGAALFVVAAAGDIAGTPVDELAEPLAGVCLLAGLVLLTSATLRRELLLGDAPLLSGGRPGGPTQFGADRPGARSRARSRPGSSTA